jgi:cyclophilin family peptidyl-prolyl cis-trans isomerase
VFSLYRVSSPFFQARQQARGFPFFLFSFIFRLDNKHVVFGKVIDGLLTGESLFFGSSFFFWEPFGTAALGVHTIVKHAFVLYIHTVFGFCLTMCVCVCVCMCIYIHIYMYKHSVCVYIYIDTCYMYTYTYTYIHTYIHSYIHTYIHTYVYTYIHSFLVSV